MKARLYYDETCPVCSNYIKLLRRKINPDRIEFLPIGSDSKDFKFATETGTLFKGEKAIEKLAQTFPQVKNYFWMLPEKYKITALKTAYRIGGAVRNVVNKTINRTKKRSGGGCGCGGKKKV